MRAHARSHADDVAHAHRAPKIEPRAQQAGEKSARSEERASPAQAEGQRTASRGAAIESTSEGRVCQRLVAFTSKLISGVARTAQPTAQFQRRDHQQSAPPLRTVADQNGRRRAVYRQVIDR